MSTIQSALSTSKKLLVGTSDSLDSAAKRYDKSDDDSAVTLTDLFRDLDPTVSTPAITPGAEKSGNGLAVPSTLLKDPESALSDPTFDIIWKILSWPDYLSLSFWGRQIINRIVQFIAPEIGGGDIFEYLSQQIGGDWDKIALSADAFEQLGKYYVGLSECVSDTSIDLFAGWQSGAGAEAAGAFFGELRSAFAGQESVFSELNTKYTDAAWAAYHACSALLSALDAAVDAIIAAISGGETLVTLLASLVDFGTTLPAAVIEAVVTVVEAFSAAWGWMMFGVSGIVSAGALLGAATTEIEFIPLPEA